MSTQTKTTPDVRCKKCGSLWSIVVEYVSVHTAALTISATGSLITGSDADEHPYEPEASRYICTECDESSEDMDDLAEVAEQEARS